ncbi:hypothetical protein MTP99_003500 [Tenebrio molitor]|nr:hypothetical protein MTP99_003500 [Tenebrio molitor]
MNAPTLPEIFTPISVTFKILGINFEASHFKTILLSTKINIESEENRNSVIALVLKLMNNNLQITACRLFSVDYDLLFKICGTVFSYLFIMLQLDQSNTFGPNVAPNETVFLKE